MAEPTLTITGEERNVLYPEVLLSVSGAGDVYFEANSGNLEKAERRARQALDELHLLVNDLGWTERESGDVVPITLPAGAFRSLIERLLVYADEPVGLEGSKEESEAMDKRYRRVKTVCRAVLARLPEPGRAG